jgi:1,4-alpha-glucan branching enzyme
MTGYLAILLHAHLPLVKHPEHERSLEESWFFEAMIETYLPLLQRLQRWQTEKIQARLTLSLSPTLCVMLRDAHLQSRFLRYTDRLLDLTDKEILRTSFLKDQQTVAKQYRHRFGALRQIYLEADGDLVKAFGSYQKKGLLEIIICSATHAVLPLLRHRPSVKAQIQVACNYYQECFGQKPNGFWLPECGYSQDLDPYLVEAGVSWCIIESQGLLGAKPPPHRGTFAPVSTPRGLKVFARDPESAFQVWSRAGGYPGDKHYRDFYRDIGFDLELEYVRPFLPIPDCRGFTGIKYHRITGPQADKQVYSASKALAVASQHATHFVQERIQALRSACQTKSPPPIIVAPYDAELFGHWWYEGLDFLDGVMRQAQDQPSSMILTTPTDYLRLHPPQQQVSPADSSWGEGGDWRVWKNSKNDWIYPLLQKAQNRFMPLLRHWPGSDRLTRRALVLAANELLLAQASDWPFILHTGTSPAYARQRIHDHLERFHRLGGQITTGKIEIRILKELEQTDLAFPDLDLSILVSPRSISY